MKRKHINILFLLIVFLLITRQASAVWIWTPKKNQWENPKDTLRETPGAQLDFASEIMESGDYKLAISEFKKLLRNYPKAKEAPRAQYYIGICLKKMEKPYDAYKILQKVIDKYPFSNLSRDVVQQQYDIATEMLDAQEGKSEFLGKITGTNYNIIEIFRKVIKNAPYGELAAPSQYKIAYYLDKNDLYQESRDEYEKVMNDYPETEWSEKAKYSIALLDAKRSTGSEYDQKVTKVAVEELEDVVDKTTDLDVVDHAVNKIQELRDKEAHNHFLVAEFYEKQKNYKSAKIYYQKIVNDYKNSQWAAKSLRKILDISRNEK